jgi:hypothetical protein
MEVNAQIHAPAALQLGKVVFTPLRTQMACSPVIVCNVRAPQYDIKSLYSCIWGLHANKHIGLYLFIEIAD